MTSVWTNDLLERVGAQVVECACVVGLREVKVMHDRLPYMLHYS